MVCKLVCKRVSKNLFISNNFAELRLSANTLYYNSLLKIICDISMVTYSCKLVIISIIYAEQNSCILEHNIEHNIEHNRLQF